MKLHHILFVFPILISTFCSAQSTGPFAIWEDQVNNDYRFVRFSAATGAKTDIKIIPALTGFVLGSKQAFNPHKNYYYFAGQSGAQAHFYTVDAATGNIVRKTLITDNVVGIEYNCKDSLLYGILVVGNVHSFCKIDSITAQATVLGGLNMSGYVGGSFSIDMAKGLYNFIANASGPYRMFSIDVKTGTVVHDNPFPDNVVGHRYNPIDSSIYGLWEDNNAYKLEKINYVNGTHSMVGTLAGVDPGYVTESHSMNESGKYTFRGFNGPSFAIISVNVSNAAVISMNNTTNTNNAVGFEEPVCVPSATGINNIDTDNSFSIFPNPTNGIFTVTLSEVEGQSFEKNSKLETVNVIGEKVHSVDLSTGQSTLDLSSQPNGIYFLQLKTDKGLANKKIIIQR